MKKIKLNRETLRRLVDPKDLKEAAGGYSERCPIEPIPTEDCDYTWYGRYCGFPPG